MNVSQAECFLHLLYPHCESGGLADAYIVLTRLEPADKPDEKGKLISDWVRLADIAKRLGPWLTTYAPEFTTYYGVGLRHPESESKPYRRGGNQSVVALPGFIFDGDDLRGVHKQTELPANEDETLAFLHGLPWRPTLIVDSSGGTHAYWLFDAPYIITDGADRDRIKALSKRFRGYIKAEAKRQHGWNFDGLSDVDIVLRLPGSLNHKTGTPKPVTLIHESGDRYSLEDFERHLPAEVPTQKRPPRQTRTDPQTTVGGASGSRVDIMAVAEHYGADLRLKSASSGEWEAAHPEHGSTTGDNFNVQPSQGVWHCWRCDSGGDALHLIAVCEALVACEDSQPGVFTGRPELYRHVVNIANETFGAAIEWRSPSQVERFGTKPFGHRAFGRRAFGATR